MKGKKSIMRAIILAAGKGSRFNSEAAHLPKVLRIANGQPLLAHVTKTLSFVDKKDTYIIVGFEKEKVMEAFPGYNYVEQKIQKGTGHAVKAAKEQFLDYDGEVVIMCGDTPLITNETIVGMVEAHRKEKNVCTLLSCVHSKHYPYGRVLRGEDGRLLEIVEDKDCTPEQYKCNEYNVGAYVFNSKELFEALEKINSNNAQNELYLTDVPGVLLSEGKRVNAFPCKHEFEIGGVNDPNDLKEAEDIMNNNPSLYNI